ncbi:right-handed parallel beta-helix repeat-containing protein [Sorangium sp. So ce1036]|uniref:right-handed parallel beta-helix repeat-containing protein n=1 Tax=Sorangium sp. So ce1036 TaxID=3133328 RepID=UPI003F0DC071
MMNRFWTWSSVMILGGAACAIAAGCDGDEPAPATCSDEDRIRGICVGVPAGDVCSGEGCARELECASVVEVANDEELESAVRSASSGACIALREGRYGVVGEVAGGVRLFGRSADAVEIEGITLGAGHGAVVRGLRVGRGGVRATGATGVRIESVRIVGEKGDERRGVDVREGSSITLVDSEIAGSGDAGVLAVDSDVTLERSVVTGAQRGGIVIEGPLCENQETCACAGRPSLVVRSSVIRRNHVIGISLRGAIAELEDVDVMNTIEGDTFELGGFGGGISAAECSNIKSARRVRVINSMSFGVLVDHSAAILGDHADEESIEISRNTRGLWIQDVQPAVADCHAGGELCVALHKARLDGNFGVGIGLTGASRGIILCKSAVLETAMESMPVFDKDNEPATDTVGDGVDWMGGSDVTVEDLILSGNARQSLLIDGPAGGSIQRLVTDDRDTPPVQQNVAAGEARPGGEAPQTVSERSASIPQAPSAPRP